MENLLLTLTCMTFSNKVLSQIDMPNKVGGILNFKNSFIMLPPFGQPILHKNYPHSIKNLFY